jgi:hypothetical protein
MFTLYCGSVQHDFLKLSNEMDQGLVGLGIYLLKNILILSLHLHNLRIQHFRLKLLPFKCDKNVLSGLKN